MPTSEAPACYNCFYSWLEVNRTGRTLYCKRYPPVYTGKDALGYKEWSYPETKEHDWCGEHKEDA